MFCNDMFSSVGIGHDIILPLRLAHNLIMIQKGKSSELLEIRARQCRALTAVSQITNMSFVPDIFTAGFAGLFFYLSLRLCEDAMVAEAIADNLEQSFPIRTLAHI